jgi:hypothetical protein
VQSAVENTNLKIMHWLTAEGDRCYLGETMVLDDAQLKFATWLRAGEALTYRDKFAEATHISILRTLTATAPPTDLVMATASPPLGTCARYRAQFGYRGPRSLWSATRRWVSKIKDAVVALEVKGPTGAEIKSRWKQLVSRLHTGWMSSPRCPRRILGHSDAAFRLFLYSLAIRTMRFSPSWPKPVATRLGIVITEATE